MIIFRDSHRKLSDVQLVKVQHPLLDGLNNLKLRMQLSKASLIEESDKIIKDQHYIHGTDKLHSIQTKITKITDDLNLSEILSKKINKIKRKLKKTQADEQQFNDNVDWDTYEDLTDEMVYLFNLCPTVP